MLISKHRSGFRFVGAVDKNDKLIWPARLGAPFHWMHGRTNAIRLESFPGMDSNERLIRGDHSRDLRRFERRESGSRIARGIDSVLLLSVIGWAIWFHDDVSNIR